MKINWEWNRRSGIYIIRNINNDKLYIGSSKNIYQRLHKHRTLLIRNNHENAYLQNAVNKHGIDNFEAIVMEYCTEDELLVKEQEYIDVYNSEYNITKLVMRNTPSESSRKKISDTLKRRYENNELYRTCKCIDVYDLDGCHLEQWDCITDFCTAKGIHQSSIIRVLQGKYLQTNGYQFKYCTDDKVIKAISKSRYDRRFDK